MEGSQAKAVSWYCFSRCSLEGEESVARSGHHLRRHSLARQCGRAGGRGWEWGAVSERQEEALHLSALFFASIAWRQLGIIILCCCSGVDLLTYSVEVPGEGGTLARVLVLFVVLVWWGRASRPSCNICHILNIGPESIWEGNGGKE